MIKSIYDLLHVVLRVDVDNRDVAIHIACAWLGVNVVVDMFIFLYITLSDKVYKALLLKTI